MRLSGPSSRRSSLTGRSIMSPASHNTHNMRASEHVMSWGEVKMLISVCCREREGEKERCCTMCTSRHIQAKWKIEMTRLQLASQHHSITACEPLQSNPVSEIEDWSLQKLISCLVCDPFQFSILDFNFHSTLQLVRVMHTNWLTKERIEKRDKNYIMFDSNILHVLYILYIFSSLVKLS